MGIKKMKSGEARSKKLKPGVWKQRDGSKILMADMETSHLENCLNMLRNKNFIGFSELESYFSEGPSGDGAQLAFDQAMGEAFNCTPCREIDQFELELLYRKRDEKKLYK